MQRRFNFQLAGVFKILAKEKLPSFAPNGVPRTFLFGAEEKSMSFLAIFPEIDVSPGTLHVRHDLTNQNITIELLAFDEWHV